MPRTTTPETAIEEMRAALRAWASFPVDATRRPMVLTTDPIAAPSSGFLTEDAKEAFLTGLFVVPPALPSGASEAAGYRVVSAAHALAMLRAAGSPAGGAPRPPVPLLITSVRLGSAPFGTDCGTTPLPAWLFSFQDVSNPGAVLAIDASHQFPAPTESLRRASVGARLGSDDRTATITFVGAPAGATDYTVDQAASNTAVTIRVRKIRSRN